MARDSCQKSTALYTHCLNQLLTALGSDLIHFTVLVPKVYQLYAIELWFKVYILRISRIICPCVCKYSE